MEISCEDIPAPKINQPVDFGLIKKNKPHVWLVNSHSISVKEKLSYWNLLNAAEQTKGDRFHFEKDKNEYLVAHGFLRQAISGYLKIPNSAILFEKGEFGKPFLKGLPNFKFNISHSKGIIALAFSFDGKEIGVDVEKMKQSFEYQLIVDRFFTAVEKEAINSYKLFYKFWTRKEALLKVTGIGVSEVLTEIDVSKNNHLVDIQERRLKPFLDDTISIKSFFWEDCAVSLAILDPNIEFEIFG